MTQPRIAVIGLGAWGRNHLRIWSELGALRVVCDRDEARVAAVQAEYPGVEGFARVGEALSHPEVDGVVIVSPAATHYDITRRALGAGKDVLVEKPLALTVGEGEDLVRLAREEKRVLMVGHVLMYHPAVRELGRLVKEGALGRIRYIYSNRLNLGRIRTEESSLWSFAPHDVALILGLTGGLPETVACHGGAYVNRDVADVTLTSLSFVGEVRAHIYVSWLHPFKEQRFVVVGDRQMAVFDDTVDWDRKLSLYPHRVDWIDGQIPVAHRAEADPVPLVANEPLRAECEHFLACMETRQPPLTDGVNALRVLRVLSAAQRSLETGGHPVRNMAGVAGVAGVAARQGPGQGAGAGVPGGREAPENREILAGRGAAAGEAEHSGREDQETHTERHVPGALLGQGGRVSAEGRRFGVGAMVHPSATIDENVVVGEGTRIWHYTHVMPGVRIGADCILGQNVYVGQGVTIGNRVKIQNNVSVYTGVTLEDEVFCGPSMVFTNVINPRSGLEKKDQFKPTRVCVGATLGANSTIVCGTTIGRHALVGAGAVVTSDVRDHALVWGVPARQSGWVCRCGETLRLREGQATCALCHERYVLDDDDRLRATEDGAPR